MVSQRAGHHQWTLSRWGVSPGSLPGAERSSETPAGKDQALYFRTRVRALLPLTKTSAIAAVCVFCTAVPWHGNGLTAFKLVFLDYKLCVWICCERFVRAFPGMGCWLARAPWELITVINVMIVITNDNKVKNGNKKLQSTASFDFEAFEGEQKRVIWGHNKGAPSLS